MWFGSAAAIVILQLLAPSGCLDANETQTPSSSPSDVKKMLDEQCKREYSVTCLKLDLAALVPTLSAVRRYKLLPGLTLEAGGFEAKVDGGPISREDVEPTLDRYLVKGLDSFINSISIRVKVMDKAVAERVHNIGKSFVNDVDGDEEDVSGRGRRKRINHALMMGGMVSAGTLLALTMSAVSAMAGKAILVSLLSLALTLMGSRGQGGGGGGSGGPAKTTYEIITHSMPHHEDYANRHFAQEIAEGYHFVKASPQVV